MAFNGQGAFEYMFSYGWAILIVLVLGILLFSLGVFNPTQTATASGFSVLKPVSWSFSGGDLDSSNVTLALENLAGQTLEIWVNDSDDKKSIKFKTGASLDCYFNRSFGITTRDTAGNTLEIKNNKVAVPVGAIITINGTIDGNGTAVASSGCGGLISSGYRYDIQIYAQDEYDVEKIDSGIITGTFI